MTCASGPTEQFKTRSLPPHFGLPDERGRPLRPQVPERTDTFVGQTVIRGEFVNSAGSTAP